MLLSGHIELDVYVGAYLRVLGENTIVIQLSWAVKNKQMQHVQWKHESCHLGTSCLSLVWYQWTRRFPLKGLTQLIESGNLLYFVMLAPFYDRICAELIRSWLMQWCGQDADGLQKALEKAVAGSEVRFYRTSVPMIHYFVSTLSRLPISSHSV